jgi:hypothetical protein
MFAFKKNVSDTVYNFVNYYFIFHAHVHRTLHCSVSPSNLLKYLNSYVRRDQKSLEVVNLQNIATEDLMHKRNNQLSVRK